MCIRDRFFAVLSMLPQLGAGGCWPRPRNDRLASAMIAAAIARVDWTITGARMFGSTWRQAIRNGELPSARAASMYSSTLTLRTWARDRRTKIGVAELSLIHI